MKGGGARFLGRLWQKRDILATCSSMVVQWMEVMSVLVQCYTFFSSFWKKVDSLSVFECLSLILTGVSGCCRGPELVPLASVGLCVTCWSTTLSRPLHWPILLVVTMSRIYYTSTVKPVYCDHSRDRMTAVVTHRWSLWKSEVCTYVFNKVLAPGET